MARTKKTEPVTMVVEPQEANSLFLGEFEAMQEIGCAVKVDDFGNVVEDLYVPSGESNGAVFAQCHPPLGVFCLTETAQVPRYATEGSACFDLRADFTGYETIRAYNSKNEEVARRIDHVNNIAMFEPGDRAMIPTNLIFDIPQGYKILVYPRSGNSLKRAITLANNVGVIDSDYVEPSFVLAKFDARVGGHVSHGEAIAQAELVPVTQASLNVLETQPVKKTTRSGGFGSTGH